LKGCKSDLVAEALELREAAARESFGAVAVEVVNAEFPAGGAPLDAWDRGQTFNRRCKRGQQLLDAPAEFRTGFLDVVDVGQQPAYHEAMVRPEATGKGLAQLRELLAQLAAGQVGQQRRIRGAGYQCHQHRATRYTQRVGGHAGELDAGVLQNLVQPIGGSRALFGQALAITGEVAQFTNRRWRYKAAAQQSVLEQLCQPRAVSDVGLASGHLLEVGGVDQQ